MVEPDGAQLCRNSGQPGAQVLDLCCGTGDMAFALRRKARKSSARILAPIFRMPCCSGLGRNLKGTELRWVEADALSLPFQDASF